MRRPPPPHRRLPATARPTRGRRDVLRRCDRVARGRAATSTSSVSRSRAFTPITSASLASARSRSSSVCVSTSAPMPRSRATASIAVSSSSAQGTDVMSSTASAPCARASITWAGCTRKSLRRTGARTDRRTASRSASDPVEMAGFREHRDRSRTAVVVGDRPGDRVVVGRDRAGARRRALHLGDQRGPGRPHRLEEVPSGRPHGGACQQGFLVERPVRRARGGPVRRSRSGIPCGPECIDGSTGAGRSATRPLAHSMRKATPRSRPPSRAARPTIAPAAPARRSVRSWSTVAMPPAAITGLPARRTRSTVARSVPASVPTRATAVTRNAGAPPATSHPRVSARPRSTGGLAPGPDPALVDLDADDDPIAEAVDHGEGPFFVDEHAGAEHHATRACVERGLRVVPRADAAASLHRSAERPDRADRVEVAGLARERAVQVDHVQPASACVDVGARRGDRIASEGPAGHGPIDGEGGEPAVGNVDRGDHLEPHRGGH